MIKRSALAISAIASMFFAIEVPAQAGVFSSYECDVSGTVCTDAATSGGSFDLFSNLNSPTTAAGGLEYQITPANTLALNQLTMLSATYNMQTGSFAGGSPRFTLFDNAFNSAYIYFGNPAGGGSFTNPNPNGVFGSTGNYADLGSSDVRVYSNGFGGDANPNTGVTFAQFVALVGSTQLSYVTLDLDAGTFAGAQELLVSNFTVNAAVDAPAPSAQGVPEPLTLSIFGAGLAGAVAMRRRKAKRA